MECLVGKSQFRCKSLLVGERLDLRSLSKLPRSELQAIATTPLTVATEGGGVAVLFRSDPCRNCAFTLSKWRSGDGNGASGS
jgi:hypothetical protein